jgi:hypothetical protein
LIKIIIKKIIIYKKEDKIVKVNIVHAMCFMINILIKYKKLKANIKINYIMLFLKEKKYLHLNQNYLFYKEINY